MNHTSAQPSRRSLQIVPDVRDTALVDGPRGDVGALDARRRALRAAFPVALVTMPFMSAEYPSIQLGLLRAIGESHGFPVSTFHLNLELATRVGAQTYADLCVMRGRMMGDWLFSVQAFGDEAPDLDARFLTDFEPDVAAQLGAPDGQLSATEAVRHRLTALRIRDEVVPAFLDAMTSKVDWSQYRVVGFSSVFQQTVASIALAKRIKALHPQVTILFGGSNFDDEMGLELARKVPCIDFAVIGEGDVAFPELLVALAEGHSAGHIKGIASRAAGGFEYRGQRRLLEDLDQLPTPRYDEYFSRAEENGLLPATRRRTTIIPFESARGCWWGQKHHCTFCGLNGEGMRFRAKSPDRVAQEMAELASANRSHHLHAVDNIIENEYMKTVLPRLAEEEAGYQLFYETKANLSREQIRGMRAAGITTFQPGIESLSTRVLRLMRKGITAAQNVNTLRWATYYGIHTYWSILWGFPGETREDCAEQARLLPHLWHLQPPMQDARIWMMRFSPIYSDPEQFPVEYRRPEASYSYVYPASIDIEKVAYVFDYKFVGALDEAAYATLHEETVRWQRSWRRARKPSLDFHFSTDFLQVVDHRTDERASYTFEGPLARLYRAAVNKSATAAKAKALAGVEASESEVERVLNEFCERGVMMREDDKYLALALPAVKGR